MDKEYLRHIQASPYVSEGVFTKAKTWASNIQPSEDPYTTPQQAQLLSYYNSFKKELIDLLKEFADGPKSPAQRLKKSKLSNQQSRVVDSLIRLYETLFPRVFPSSFSSQQKQYLSRGLQTRPRGDSGQFVKATKHLDKIEPNGRQQPTTPVTEGWYQREKAKGTGNPKIIILQYLQDFREIYNRFLTNVKKVLPNVDRNSLAREFKRIIKDPKINKEFDSIGGTLKSSPSPKAPSASAAPVSQPTGSIAAQPTGSAATGSAATAGGKLNIQPNDLVNIIATAMNTITNAVMGDDSVDAKHYFGKPITGSSGEITGYYLPTTLDEPRPTEPEWHTPVHGALPIKSVPPVSLSMTHDPSQPTIGGSAGSYTIGSYPTGSAATGNITEQTPSTSTPSTTPVAGTTTPTPSSLTPAQQGEIEKFQEEPGQFVYNFSGKWAKNRGAGVIEVTSPEAGTSNPIELPLEKSGTFIFRIFWRWDERKNVISIRYSKGNVWVKSDLMMFYDHEASSIGTGGPPTFNAMEAVSKINPAAAGLINKATNKGILDQAELHFKPAIMAIVHRKGPIEFKAHKRLQFVIEDNWLGTPDKDGTVRIEYGKILVPELKPNKYERGTEIKKEELLKIRTYYQIKRTNANKDEDSKKEYESQIKKADKSFEYALSECRYFERYPKMSDWFKDARNLTDAQMQIAKDAPTLLDHSRTDAQAAKEEPESPEGPEGPEGIPDTTSKESETSVTPPPSERPSETDITNHLTDLPKEFAAVARPLWKKFKTLRMKLNAVVMFIAISKQMFKNHPKDVNAYKNNFANSLVKSLDNLDEKEAAKQLKKSFEVKESNTLSNGLINPFQSSNFI